MKEYARYKGGSLCIVFTQNMLKGMKQAKRKNDEIILEEHRAEEELRQKVKEDADKKKEEAMLKCWKEAMLENQIKIQKKMRCLNKKREA